MARLSDSPPPLTLTIMKRLMIITVLGIALATAAVAQQSASQPAEAPKQPPAPAQKPAEAPAASATQPAQPNQQQSAEQVLNELLKRRAENPLIEPARPDTPAGTARTTDTTATPTRPMGTAPTIASGAPLRREGQFVINRRARLVRTPATIGSAEGPSHALPWMVVFDADAEGLQDPPMFVMPCQLLQDIETTAQQQGDAAVFLVSGQVYVYRGANYLLPTIIQLAHDRGNLQP